MQSRTVFRVPHTCRVIKSPGFTRNMSIVPTHPFWGTSRTWGSDFAPLFRIMDEPNFPFVGPFSGHQARLQPNFSFSPRFDVREVEDKYELRGELPGVDAANLQVEFTDENTLVVSGRSEREYSSGTPPAAADKAVEGAASEEAETTKAVQAEEADDNASTYSTGSYQKPSVADGEEVDEAVATPAESVATAEAAPAAEAETAKTTEAAVEKTEQKTAESRSRYWISERSTGTFRRTFNFPNRVDQEAVTASLKNGILNIVVPKLAAPAAKRITVE